MKSLTTSTLFLGAASAITLNPSDSNSIKNAAKSVAKNLVSYYHGNEVGQTPGLLPGPPPNGDYYWWESGVMCNTLIEYWHFTGDSTYNDLIAQGMLWQAGPDNDLMPPNVTASLGNDDQGLWGMAALTAAETGLTNPSNNLEGSWLNIAKNVFTSQTQRWNDTEACGGGLRWQVFKLNIGYEYKNSISTGVLFNIAARLSRFAGNSTYADWAEKTWSWMESVGYMVDGEIYDGAQVGNNCTDVNKVRFSYVAGVYLQGAAYMYNATGGSAVWEKRLTTLLTATVETFFNSDGVVVEPACETNDKCDTDMRAFRGILLRSLASVEKLAPYTTKQRGAVLQDSAVAAASSCGDAGEQGAECGFVWTTGEDDGSHGAGEQMSALSALSVLFVNAVGAPANGSATTGASGSNGGSGTSRGNSTQSSAAPTSTTTQAKKSGAGMTAGKAGTGLLVASAVMAVVFTALLAQVCE